MTDFSSTNTRNRLAVDAETIPAMGLPHSHNPRRNRHRLTAKQTKRKVAVATLGSLV
jgi:hypothetical protein